MRPTRTKQGKKTNTTVVTTTDGKALDGVPRAHHNNQSMVHARIALTGLKETKKGTKRTKTKLITSKITQFYTRQGKLDAKRRRTTQTEQREETQMELHGAEARTHKRNKYNEKKEHTANTKLD
jgi:hypothetical protein